MNCPYCNSLITATIQDREWREDGIHIMGDKCTVCKRLLPYKTIDNERERFIKILKDRIAKQEELGERAEANGLKSRALAHFYAMEELKFILGEIREHPEDCDCILCEGKGEENGN